MQEKTAKELKRKINDRKASNALSDVLVFGGEGFNITDADIHLLVTDEDDESENEGEYVSLDFDDDNTVENFMEQYGEEEQEEQEKPASKPKTPLNKVSGATKQKKKVNRVIIE